MLLYMATRLYLVRHGETNGASDLRYWGSTDVELSPLGIRQAECLRERLASEKIETIYSSNLQRAVRTAQIINAAQNAPLAIAPELKEIDFGELEGLSFPEIRDRYPQASAVALGRSLGGCYPGGDSLEGFRERVLSFLRRLDGHPGQRLLIVAHSGTLRVLICHLLGMSPDNWWPMRLNLASLSVLELRSKEAALLSLNDICHLSE